ncbi:MAG: hypothetical protein PHH77_07720 [Victivallaceae bacterium]|nr:hypothetical protein [Victivallaceae bacterium]
MPYRPLEDIADDIIAALEATEAFKSVSKAAIDNHAQLLEHAANITGAPKAVVCIGDGRWTKRAMIREFSVAIVVMAKFHKGLESKAESVWTLADAAAAPFLPVTDDELEPVVPVFPEINGVKYELKNWAPLETVKAAASFVIELAATEVMKY